MYKLSKVGKLKGYKSYTPSIRHRKSVYFGDNFIRLKKLSHKHKYHAGRNVSGKITVRHQGGRAKRIYRIIDLKRIENKYSYVYNLNREYDPNRKSNIDRVYTGQFKSFYILSSASRSSKMSNIYTSKELNYNFSDHYKLKDILLGKEIYNVQPLNLIRGAGTRGTLISKKENSVILKLPSKKLIELDNNYTGSIGRVDNMVHNLRVLGKAGVNRWLGKRPTVKGNVMNAVDHPHGGNTKGGHGVPKTKWGKSAKWKKLKKK